METTELENNNALDEPGLEVTEGILKLGNRLEFTMMIINETNKSYRLKRGCPVGKVKDLQMKYKRIVFSVKSNLKRVSENTKSCQRF
jgi:hypothetical protein